MNALPVGYKRPRKQRGIWFDRTDDFISVADSPILHLGTGGFTVSGQIVKTETVAWYDGIIAKGHYHHENKHVILCLYANRPAFSVNDGLTSFQTIFSGGSILMDSVPYSLTCTVEKPNTTQAIIKMYLDGGQDGETRNLTLLGDGECWTPDYGGEANNLNLGVSRGGDWFGGNIRNACIYNRVLSLAEIAALADGQIVGSGLVCAYRLLGDQIDGTMAYDSSGNGLHGTIYGSPELCQVHRRGRVIKDGVLL